MEETEKYITEALGIDGTLFQLKVLDMVKKHPLFLSSFVAEEYPVGINELTTRIDFIFNKIESYYFVFECKKAHPDYKTWVFHVPINKEKTRKMQIYFHELKGVRPTIDQKIGIDNIFPGLFFYSSKHAVEIRLDISKEAAKDKKAKSFIHDTIELASFQLTKGLHGFVKEIISDNLSKEKPIKSGFVPILVTNAELKVAKYDINNVNHEGKALPEDITYEKVDYIVYNYGRDESIRLKEDNQETKSNLHQRAEYKVRPFFIVNINYLSRFLNLFHEYEQNYGLQ